MQWLGPAFLATGAFLLTWQDDAQAKPETTKVAAAPGTEATEASAPAAETAHEDPATQPDTTAAPAPAQTSASDAAGNEPMPAPTPDAKPGPPLYYVEQQNPKERPAQPNYYGGRTYEPPPPPLYYYEPPPPPRLPPKAPPRTALWFGARAAWFVPFGSVWLNQADDGNGFFYRHRSFADYASPGVAGELDLGVRLSRRYNLFALWEHAALAPGGLDKNELGGQRWGATNLYGAGLRFSSDPASVGFLMELTLGYREFHTSWADGTRLSLDGAFDARIGIGADVRLNRRFSLSPMLVLGGGSFNNPNFTGPGASTLSDATAFRQPGEYGTFELEIGAHADMF